MTTRLKRSRTKNATTLVALPVHSGVRVSPKAFARLCALNSDLRLERTARGELIAMAPAGSDSGRRNADLTMQVVVWTKADGRGIAFDSSAGFTLPNGAVRAPDSAWIFRHRWDALSPAERDGFARICPDFAVELRSESDGKKDARKKMAEYVSQGARLAWLIDPLDGEVEIYRQGKPLEVLKAPRTLSGEDVLPGFVLDLQGILFD